jgi:hypothetical protein
VKFFGTIDCNRCSPAERCKGKTQRELDIYGCGRFRPPSEGWQLAELALAHPTSLNRALSALPFEANLNFYLKAR